MRSEPDLHVECAEQSLGVDDLGLDLDHEQDSLPGMPTQQVDAPSIPVSVEACLRDDLPTPAFETLLPSSLQPTVVFIQQPIQLGAAPFHPELEARLEHLQASTEHLQGHAIHVAAFDQRYRRPMNASADGDVLLPLAPAAAQGTGDLPDLDVTHAPSVWLEWLSAD